MTIHSCIVFCSLTFLVNAKVLRIHGIFCDCSFYLPVIGIELICGSSSSTIADPSSSEVLLRGVSGSCCSVPRDGLLLLLLLLLLKLLGRIVARRRRSRLLRADKNPRVGVIPDRVAGRRDGGGEAAAVAAAPGSCHSSAGTAQFLVHFSVDRVIFDVLFGRLQIYNYEKSYISIE